MKPTLYPFSAIVGQSQMKSALLLNAVCPGIGGVLIRGHKGTGKSTAVRALARILPPVEVVADCPFHCRADGRAVMCEQCRKKAGQEDSLPTHLRAMPLVELPLSATEDRVVGTLHVEHAMKTGERRFDPGLMAAANGGILYVDEVNLLDDHLVDILLDAAASGVNVVEREGISHSHPAGFMLVGTMNPEEGELRPQFLDRFGLSLTVESLTNSRMRQEIVRRRIAFDQDPQAFTAAWAGTEQLLAQQIEQAHLAEAARLVLPHRMTHMVMSTSQTRKDKIEEILAETLDGQAHTEGSSDGPDEADTAADDWDDVTTQVPGSWAASNMDMIFSFLEEKKKLFLTPMN